MLIEFKNKLPLTIPLDGLRTTTASPLPRRHRLRDQRGQALGFAASLVEERVQKKKKQTKKL